MSLLMPELERQLRAAAHAPRTDPQPTPVRRRRIPLFGAGVVIASGGVALAVAALALILAGHGRRTHAAGALGNSAPPVSLASLPACPQQVGGAFVPARRYATVAGGMLRGYGWRLQADPSWHGVERIERGRLIIAGVEDRFCPAVESIDVITKPVPVVYGLSRPALDTGSCFGLARAPCRRWSGASRG